MWLERAVDRAEERAAVALALGIGIAASAAYIRSFIQRL
jgi:hypothetical protein